MATPGRSWMLAMGLVSLAMLLALPAPEGMSPAAKQTAVIGAFIAFLWVSEIVPLAAAALLPVVAFPLAGVASLEKTAQAYAHPLILLLMGGFMLSAAIERWRLHERMAMLVIGLSGRRPDRLVASMMCTTAFLSIWVSNTAAAMVMVPIAASLLGGGETKEGEFGAALMLGIAFSATIGGMGSLIGTPPNALFAGYMQTTHGVTIGFGQWMLIGIPIVLVLLPITWLVLTRFAFKLPRAVLVTATFPSAMAPMTLPERMVTIVLATTALAWIARPLIAETLGWTALTDAGIAIAAVLVLFMLPARFEGTHRPLLEWRDVERIRWDVLILFGGGLALADAVASSGLATWIGEQFGGIGGLPVFLLVLIMMTVVVYLGELASNTAVAAVFLPIAGAAAAGLGVHPLALVLPVALAASLGFMLPVATPPNAIVYGTRAVTSRQMLKAGAALDVVSILVVYVIAMLLGPLVLGP